MPRLFAGLELPSEVADDLTDIQQPLPGARWVNADDLHITLRFFGDLSKRQADELIHCLDGIEEPMFEVVVRGLGTFGGRDPRTLWAGVEPHPHLMALQAAIERAARSAGLAMETRKYHPHITLARLDRAPELALARLISRRNLRVSHTFAPSRFALFSSKPKVGGGPYVVEQVFPLIGGSWDDEWDHDEDGQVWGGGWL